VPIRWASFLLLAYLFVLVWADGTATNPADPDLWHRLALGETLWRTGHFPPGDYFSYLADYKNVADHEWGSALIFYGAWQLGGGGAIVALKLITLAITITLLAWAGMQGRRPTVLLAAFYAVVIVALLPSFQSTVRCMTFTHIFFALWLYWFQCERHGRAIPTWAYLLTVVVWANLHGGFAIGLAWLLGVALVQAWEGQAWRMWAVRFGLCSLATLINPFGWQLWISTGRALVTTRRGFPEWGPVSWWPDLMVYPGYKLLLFVVLGAVAVMVWRRGWRRVDHTAILLMGGALALSLTSARHTSLFAVVAGALLPDFLPPEPAAETIANPIPRLGYIAGRFALLLVPLYAPFVVLPGDGMQLAYPSVSCPIGAVDYLERENVRGKLLVPFNYGSYALWRLRGRMRVSMDGRYDLVYRPETYQKVDDFFYARGDWTQLLQSPAPDAILLPVADAVYPRLRAQPGWTEVYHNATDAVFLPR
jgi:hypothetical protein